MLQAGFIRQSRDTLKAERDGKLVKTGWTNARCKDMTWPFVTYIKPQRIPPSKRASGKMPATTVLEQICALEELKKSMTVTSSV